LALLDQIFVLKYLCINSVTFILYFFTTDYTDYTDILRFNLCNLCNLWLQYECNKIFDEALNILSYVLSFFFPAIDCELSVKSFPLYSHQARLYFLKQS